MAYEHKSGLPGAYDRTEAQPDRSGVIFIENNFIQAADLNELQSRERARNTRGHDLIAQDGDRHAGGAIIVVRATEDAATVTVTLDAGRIYLDGDVHPVPAAVISDVPGIGEVEIGVKLTVDFITHEDDPSLVGLHEGTAAELEPGAARSREHLVWALADDDQPGVFAPVYKLVDGAPISQAPPSALTPVYAHVAQYDREANGHYIVEGCAVTALGRDGLDQVFSIADGTANINGWKRRREFALSLRQEEAPDLEQIDAEVHTYTAADGSQTLVTLNRPPVAAVQSVIVVKRITESVVRGPIAGGADELSKSSIVVIESVVQGATTYQDGVDYSLVGDQVSWGLGGNVPASLSTYEVTYLYNEAQAPDSVTPRAIAVSGGVQGRPILVTYTSKLPRVDLVCLGPEGEPVYVAGVSARHGAVASRTPDNLLKLAEVSNDWDGAPIVQNNGTSRYTFDEMRRYFDRVVDMLQQFDRAESHRDILERAPVSKNGIFTDNFVDDFYRDQGEPQTASSADGVLSLAIDEVLNTLAGTTVETLPFEEVVILSQPLRTSEMRINPWANFNPMPAGLSLEPAVDFWTEQQTAWTSPVTQEFQAAPGQPPGSTTRTEQVSSRQTVARWLRQRSVNFHVEGFGAGEILQSLVFDGRDITPAGPLVADGNGEIAASFQVPSGVPVGARLVRAEGAAGSFAEALYVGSGEITTITLRRVTLITRAAPPPPPPPAAPRPVPPPETRRTETHQEWMRRTGWSARGEADPLAQTFTLPEGRQIAGVDLWAGSLGDPSNGIRVQLSTVENGAPTMEVMAEAFLSMQGVATGDRLRFRFPVPVFVPAGVETCFVVMTDDAGHALDIARLGDVVDLGGGRQGRVSSQPYTIGVLLTSSNRRTWTAVQDADLAFELIGAAFTATHRTIDLWSGAFDQISDVQVRGAFELPTADTRLSYELVRANGSVLRFADRQRVQFEDYVSEAVTLRAVLEGTERAAPTLYPGTWLLGGKIRESGTYVTRQFEMGANVDLGAVVASQVPAGATLTVEADATDDNWSPLTNSETQVLGAELERAGLRAGPDMTPRMAAGCGWSLTGGPGARPYLARLRAYSI